MKNTLFYGDNLSILRDHFPDGCIDLVYLDPPFKSDQDYNVLFRNREGVESAAQIKAFEDTWRWDQAAAEAYEDVVTGHTLGYCDITVSRAMQGLRAMLGESDMMAYLSMMAPRLMELRRVMKDAASLYLHCDPTASHYLKLLLDAVFGPERFRNEIVWRRTTRHSDSKNWSAVHDTLLYYVKGSGYAWNPLYLPYSDEYVQQKYRHADADGRRYRLDNMTSPSPRPNMMYEWKGHQSPANGWRYSQETMAKLDADGRIWYPDSKAKRPQLKRYLDEMPGLLATDVWSDISPLNSRAAERLGYPTQKPASLLERIIGASSQEGALVLDPFCGCGTTIDAAEKLGRRWIGIDITHLAITLIKHRLSDTYGDTIDYDVKGEPTTLEGAKALALEDRFQFQYWALGLVGARPQEQKRGADRGIDGRLFFRDEKKGTKQVILSVKSGTHVGVKDVRDLRGVLDREGAQIGVLLTLHDPTGPMRKEAAAAGFYKSPGWNTRHLRMQILTVKELLEGTLIDMPPVRHTSVTYQRAPRRKQNDEGVQADLGF